MDMPEKFLHLTATGWTAIGSIVGAISIVVLSVFNFFTLRATDKAVSAAREQADVANKSLQELQQKSLEEHVLRRETAIAAARELKRNAQNWKSALNKPEPGDNVYLLPRDWTSLTSYAALFRPQDTAEIANVQGQIAETETHLIKYMMQPYHVRAVVSSGMHMISERLESLVAISDSLGSHVVRWQLAVSQPSVRVLRSVYGRAASLLSVREGHLPLPSI